MYSPDRDVLRSLLKRWQDGALDAFGVKMQAEAIWERDPIYGHYEEYSRDDPRSIYYAVLFNLEALSQQLILPDDIPVILSFLDTPLGKEREAWQMWDTYWNNIDYEKRRLALLDNPHYMKWAGIP